MIRANAAQGIRKIPRRIVTGPAAATRTGITQSFAAAGILDTEPVWFAGDFLPNLPTLFPELVADDPQLVRDLLQPLLDNPDCPLSYAMDRGAPLARRNWLLRQCRAVQLIEAVPEE